MANVSEIQITLSEEVSTKPLPQGRLYIVFSRSDDLEPRLYSAWPVKGVEPLYAVDLESLQNRSTIQVSNLVGFPYETLSELPEGEWYVQAVYDTNTIHSGINSPNNAYSNIQKVAINSSESTVLSLHLHQRIPADSLPEQQRHLKFVKFKSKTLSEFWDQDIFLRAGLILPRTYFDNPLARFPVFFDIGGYGSRYTRAERLYNDEAFQAYWNDDDTPQMIIVFLDGEAPFGDPYQINSANNGPYGDATWGELLPYLSQNFNMVDTMEGRFVSGCSTGGWVSLALQIYYPDIFNGAWSYSADGVDFNFFQLVDIYNDDNAFFNSHDQERPSYRQKDGDIIFSIKHEIMMENTMGRGNSYTTSGGQWGGWNAVYSPKGEDGLPMPIWDPNTGKIDKNVASAWKKYDLNEYTESNWKKLGNKLQGKLHIWMGDMDNFYLNNAMVLFEEMLKRTNEPTSDAEFRWERGIGHCDFDSLEMRKYTISKMSERYEQTKKTT
ncbi:alpha/beta hydrolase-fold protein [Ningiella sp. W23]|uniref:alpha/beta hydrolase-fold protein n=1 Tax=Ningiella sp. W23 TaxID=3023715 RepID=UPI0037566436